MQWKQGPGGALSESTCPLVSRQSHSPKGHRGKHFPHEDPCVSLTDPLQDPRQTPGVVSPMGGQEALSHRRLGGRNELQHTAALGEPGGQRALG